MAKKTRRGTTAMENSVGHGYSCQLRHLITLSSAHRGNGLESNLKEVGTLKEKECVVAKDKARA